MQAEVLGLGARFEVLPAAGEDRPPEHVTISVRPCWRKPVEQIRLAYVYEDRGVAFYAAE
jgi:hypothetical protein